MLSRNIVGVEPEPEVKRIFAFTQTFIEFSQMSTYIG